jgi:uncharacterized membrane protein
MLWEGIERAFSVLGRVTSVCLRSFGVVVVVVVVVVLVLVVVVVERGTKECVIRSLNN